MDTFYQQIKDDPEKCCREAMRLLNQQKATVAQQNQGIRYLTRAVKLHHPEAMYRMGQLFLARRLKPLQGEAEELGQKLMTEAVRLGYTPEE